VQSPAHEESDPPLLPSASEWADRGFSLLLLFFEFFVFYEATYSGEP